MFMLFSIMLKKQILQFRNANLNEKVTIKQENYEKKIFKKQTKNLNNQQNVYFNGLSGPKNLGNIYQLTKKNNKEFNLHI